MLEPSFEHAVVLTRGSARIAETDLAVGSLLYLPPGRDEVAITAKEGTVLMLLGGMPLGESLLMWWNFVARTPDEIASAVEGWREGVFGRVGGYAGKPLDPPPLDVSRLVRRP